MSEAIVVCRSLTLPPSATAFRRDATVRWLRELGVQQALALAEGDGPYRLTFERAAQEHSTGWTTYTVTTRLAPIA